MNEELKGDPKTLIKLTRGLMHDKIDASEVPPSLVAEIETILEAAKKRAISDGAVEKVKQIHHAKELLENRNRRPKTNRRQKKSAVISQNSTIINPYQNTTNRPKSILLLRNTANQSAVSRPKAQQRFARSEIIGSRDNSMRRKPEDLDQVLSDLQNGYEIQDKDIDTLPDLVDYSREKTEILVEEGKLNEAQEAQDLHEYTDLLLSRKEKIMYRNRVRSDLSDKIDQRMADIDQTKEERKKYLQDSNENIENLIREENEQFENDMIEFDKVTEGEIPPYHKRFSPELLNLRQQESYLIKTKRYAEAATVRQMADKKEENELLRIDSNWRQYRANLKKKLTLEHKKRLLVIQGRTDIKQTKKRQRADYKIETIELSMNLLKNQMKTLDEGSKHIEIGPMVKKTPQTQSFSTQTTSRNISSNSTTARTTSTLNSAISTKSTYQQHYRKDVPYPKSSIAQWSTTKIDNKTPRKH